MKDNTVKTKRLFSEAEIGDVVGVPLGMELLTSTRITKIYLDDNGHKCADGELVHRVGFASRCPLKTAGIVSFCL